jgi:ATP-dependent HslUV protease subunit HslV
MTTIAWDGKRLASDRCSWSGGVRRRVRKVYRVTRADDGVWLVALTGCQPFCNALLPWLRGEAPAPKCAEFKVEPDSCCGVVIDERCRVWELSGGLTFSCMRERIYAQGIGQEFAWGALEAGATARRAVEIAIKRSDYAGLGVDTVGF